MTKVKKQQDRKPKPSSVIVSRDSKTKIVGKRQARPGRNTVVKPVGSQKIVNTNKRKKPSTGIIIKADLTQYDVKRKAAPRRKEPIRLH